MKIIKYRGFEIGNIRPFELTVFRWFIQVDGKFPTQCPKFKTLKEARSYIDNNWEFWKFYFESRCV
jgi:hypothetical protein